ncbi:TIGR03985 family CRISPR-associated protein, partial [Merismopedia glauca]
DFYQPEQFMILRFNPDFARRYIDNSFRHSSFEKIDDFQEVISILKQESEEKYREKLISIAHLSLNHSYYLLRYRQNDNNVIMRLRAWGHNVEVICPWDLRQRMREDLQKTWGLYEND